MAERYVITLGRECGAGATYIAQHLSKELGIPYYDKDIFRMVSDKSGVLEEFFHVNSERPGNNLLYKLVKDLKPADQKPSLGKDIVSPDNLFRFQSELIRELADNESCIIIGRCADYVLKENPNVVSVFIHADKKFCLERALERNSMTEKEMQKYIEKTDRFRGDFYRYHTGNEWADARNYDLCLNSGKLGFQKCVEEIKSYIKIRFNDKN